MWIPISVSIHSKCFIFLLLWDIRLSSFLYSETDRFQAHTGTSSLSSVQSITLFLSTHIRVYWINILSFESFLPKIYVPWNFLFHLPLLAVTSLLHLTDMWSQTLRTWGGDLYLFMRVSCKRKFDTNAGSPFQLHNCILCLVVTARSRIYTIFSQNHNSNAVSAASYIVVKKISLPWCFDCPLYFD